MIIDNEGSMATGILRNGVYTVFRERGLETTINLGASNNSIKNLKEDDGDKKGTFVVNEYASHYFTLIIIGLLSWGVVWCAFGANWGYDGMWFRLAVVAAGAWATGCVLEGTTTLPPLLAALATGILARHMGYLDMRDFPEVDGLLRKIYPVVILGKGSLAWNLGFMRDEWARVATLGCAPWTLEVLAVAACTHLLLGFPWVWGLLLGSFYCSVSCPVLMPSVVRLQDAVNPKRSWPQLLCTAGGVDTALSVGFFGIVFSYAMFPASDTYRIVKALLTMFAGVGLGAAWGGLARLAPHRNDAYVAPLRVLLVLLGGLFGNYITSMFGWAGTGGVAVLVCNATAANIWARDGEAWKLNQNPASTTYRILWAMCEPALFAYTGTYFVLDDRTLQLLPLALAILAVCLAVRLAAAAAVSWGMTLRERLAVCCLWTPKSIVEAVLCPVLLNTLILEGVSPEDPHLKYAEDILRLTVVAIVVTTPAGFLLTRHVAPLLLATKSRSSSVDAGSLPPAPAPTYKKRKSTSDCNVQHEDYKI